MSTRDTTQHFANLLQEHLDGPRWPITKEVISSHPESLGELMFSVIDHVGSLAERIGKVDPEPDGDIDLRVSAEEVVILLGRLSQSSTRSLQTST